MESSIMAVILVWIVGGLFFIRSATVAAPNENSEALLAGLRRGEVAAFVAAGDVSGRLASRVRRRACRQVAILTTPGGSGFDAVAALSPKNLQPGARFQAITVPTLAPTFCHKSLFLLSYFM